MVVEGRGVKIPTEKTSFWEMLYISMKTYTVVVEKNNGNGSYEGHIPTLPGAKSQGRTIRELNQNLRLIVKQLLKKSDKDTYIDFQFLTEMTLIRK